MLFKCLDRKTPQEKYTAEKEKLEIQRERLATSLIKLFTNYCLREKQWSYISCDIELQKIETAFHHVPETSQDGPQSSQTTNFEAWFEKDSNTFHILEKHNDYYLFFGKKAINVFWLLIILIDGWENIKDFRYSLLNDKCIEISLHAWVLYNQIPGVPSQSNTTANMIKWYSYTPRTNKESMRPQDPWTKSPKPFFEALSDVIKGKPLNQSADATHKLEEWKEILETLNDPLKDKNQQGAPAFFNIFTGVYEYKQLCHRLNELYEKKIRLEKTNTIFLAPNNNRSPNDEEPLSRPLLI